MFGLDSHTLVVSSALLSFIMCLTMSAMYFSNRSEKCLADWAYSGGLNVLGYIGSTFTLEPSWISTGVTNSLFVLAHLAIIRGLLRHLSLGLYTRSMCLYVSVFFLLHALPSIDNDLSNRIILFTLFGCAIKLISIILLLKAWRRTKQWTYLPLAMVESFFALQLIVRSISIGFSDRLQIYAFTDHWIQSIGWLSDLLFISVATLSCSLIIVRKQVLEIHKLSRTDSLSECLNRLALNEIAPSKLEQAQHANKHLVCVMLDIDHFKKINDTFGHAAGDIAIKKVADVAKSCIRETDDIFRIGGEEFLILVLADSLELGAELAERIRSEVEKSPVLFEENKINVKVSLGVSQYTEIDDSWTVSMNRADEALYNAKNTGRSRVAISA